MLVHWSGSSATASWRCHWWRLLRSWSARALRGRKLASHRHWWWRELLRSSHWWRTRSCRGSVWIVHCWHCWLSRWSHALRSSSLWRARLGRGHRLLMTTRILLHWGWSCHWRRPHSLLLWGSSWWSSGWRSRRRLRHRLLCLWSLLSNFGRIESVHATAGHSTGGLRPGRHVLGRNLSWHRWSRWKWSSFGGTNVWWPG